MVRIYLTNLLFLLALGLFATSVVGCGKNSAEGKRTVKVEMDNSSVELAVSNDVSAAETQLSSEEKEALEMRDLLDEGQTLAAIRHARNLMDSDSKHIRLLVLETLSWIGSRAMPEITEMINDSDSEVSAEALSAWELAFSEICGEHRQAAKISETLQKLTKPDSVTGILQHVAELSEDVALPMLANVIDSNATNFIGECAREMFTHISGGEIYDGKKALHKFILEVKESETMKKEDANETK